MLKTLYICRPVLNANEILDFFKKQGFEKLCVAEDLHVTIIYSKTKVNWNTISPDTRSLRIVNPYNRVVKTLGDKGAIVMSIESTALQARFKQLLELGCVSDYESYKPHITITYNKPEFNLNLISAFPGEILLGPEKREEIIEEWRPTEKSDMHIAPQDSFVIDIPLIVKAGPILANGDRHISFECSNEIPDSEGDVILQKALLDSAESFVRSGAIDLDHISEIGQRYGLNPAEYVVGRPTRVFDLGGNRTGVEAVLLKGNPHADKIWEELTAEPPVIYKASIYGFPKPGNEGIINVQTQPYENNYGASRYVVKAITWKSLALTKSPVNTSIKHPVKILKSIPLFMKANEEYLAKTYGGFAEQANIDVGPMISNGGTTLNPMGFPANKVPTDNVAPNGFLHPPRNRVESLGHFTHHIQKGHCPHTALAKANSVYSFREHFKHCCGLDADSADLQALALMYLLKHRTI